jgi:hypothetical protein
MTDDKNSATKPAPTSPTDKPLEPKPDDTPKYPPYADATLVTVEQPDGTRIACTYKYYKEYHEDSGAKVLHKFEPSKNPRTKELEKLLGADED